MACITLLLFFQCLICMVAALLITPWVLLGIIVFTLYRSLLHWLFYLIYKEQWVLLSGIDAQVGQETKNTSSAINIILLCEGFFDRQIAITRWIDRVVNAIAPNGRLLHPRLHQYIDERWGYLWFRPAVRFDTADHFIMCDGLSVQSEADLKTVLGSLVNRRFKKAVSPWEWIFIPLAEDFEENQCTSGYKLPLLCIVGRFHHGLGDGISLLRLLISSMGDDPNVLDSVPMPPSRQNRINLFRTILQPIRMLFLGPRDTFWQLAIPKSNVLHGPIVSGDMLLSYSTEVDLEMVIQIKNKLNVTVNDIILSCVGDALNRYFNSLNCRCPQSVFIVMPIGMHNLSKPVQLCNDISLIRFNLVTGNYTPLERLQITRTRINKLKKSPVLYINYYILALITNRVPIFITRPFYQIIPFTLFLSTMPGPKKPICLLESLEVKKALYTIPLHHRIACSIQVFSYGGKIGISTIADKNIINSQSSVDNISANFAKAVMELSIAIETLSQNNFQ